MIVATADKIEELKRYLVFFTEEDYADLSTYAHDVEHALDTHDPDELREATVRVVFDLMSDGLISPGFPTRHGGFEPWSYDAERAARCIDRYWERLGRTPTLGEVVWFRTTPKGRELAVDYSPEESGLGLEPEE